MPHKLLDGHAGASDNSAMTEHATRLPFSLEPLIAEAKRRMRKRQVLVLALAVVLIGGGAAGATVGPNSSDAIQPAGACPTTGGFYAYAVSDDPAHPPAAGSGPTSWGWTPRKHQVRSATGCA